MFGAEVAGGAQTETITQYIFVLYPICYKNIHVEYVVNVLPRKRL